jgi:hypothetical protein
VKDSLASLALRFSDESVDLDQSVFNAARICKVYGTLAAKGEATSDRPHRRSHLIEVPDQIQITTAEHWNGILVPAIAESVRPHGKFDLGEWLKSHGIAIGKAGDWNGGVRYAFNCPWNSEHDNVSAFALRLANGALSAGCLHTSCRHRTWQDLRDLFEPNRKASRSRPERPNRKSELLALTEDMEFFVSRDGEPFATFNVDGHRETWHLQSKRFVQTLADRMYERTGDVLPAQTLQDTIRVLECRARKGDQLEVWLRVADHGDKIYIDVGDKTWRAIEVDAMGYRIIDNPPVRFRRSQSTQPFPMPVVGGNLDDFFELINISDPDDRVMIVSWMLAALRPSGPHPILAIHGEPGSAKSSATRITRLQTDPNACPLRGEPKDLRDLMIAAQSNWVLSFDNFSYIPDWMSDAFCRLATGGDFATRELYTNSEEIVISARRPIILNGIDELATRSDLLERCLVVHLPTIDKANRKTERELGEKLGLMQGALFGRLLDGVSCALRKLDSTHLEELPRLADFLLWATAAEDAMGWPKGTVQAAYERNVTNANEIALGASPLVAPLAAFMKERTAWEGTATELLSELTSELERGAQYQRNWPKNATSLSGRLRRVASNLRKAGLHIDFFQSTDAARTRLIRLSGKLPETREGGDRNPF